MVGLASPNVYFISSRSNTLFVLQDNRNGGTWFTQNERFVYFALEELLLVILKELWGIGAMISTTVAKKKKLATAQKVIYSESLGLFPEVLLWMMIIMRWKSSRLHDNVDDSSYASIASPRIMMIAMMMIMEKNWWGSKAESCILDAWLLLVFERKLRRNNNGYKIKCDSSWTLGHGMPQ